MHKCLSVFGVEKGIKEVKEAEGCSYRSGPFLRRDLKASWHLVKDSSHLKGEEHSC